MSTPLVSNVFVKASQFDSQIANNQSQCHQLLESISEALNYQILGTQFHQFQPQGLSGALLLSESHITIHTWPEHKFATIELLTCKPFNQSQKQILIDHIKQVCPQSQLAITINT